MGALGWIGLVVGSVAGFAVLQLIYLSIVLRWEDDRTVGLGYYGLHSTERARFKGTLRTHARLLAPILRLGIRFIRLDFRKARFQYRGVSGPMGSCSAETFAAAVAFKPLPEDVFVVTQMKCGTTWMQHVVYEVVNRGLGDLVATGTTLYSQCPWLEGRKSVPIELAPRLGRERPSRIIKTHLPAELCPAEPAARYIYVARHPVSCFASCVDFVRTNVGATAPPLPVFEAWFTDPDLMWWGTWSHHVKGWWDRAARDSNVLVVLFEDMKKDLPSVVKQVAGFLGVTPLSDAELALVVEKCGFQYMQTHQDLFEMHPPHILQVDAELFVRGTAERHKDVPAETRERLAGWAVREMAGSSFPLARAYPDLR